MASLRTRASTEKPKRWLAKGFLLLPASGPAILFENVSGHNMPVLCNLFGTSERVARAMGVAELISPYPFGEVPASLKEPEAPKGFREVVGMRSLLKTLWNMALKELLSAPY